jgi:hypothetical protein
MRLALLAAVVGLVGCRTQWTAKVEQPALVLGATQDARTSLPASIVVRDMELPRVFKLVNSVYYTVVSKDRLRFRVMLHHKCDVRNWGIWLEDGDGAIYIPEAVDQRRVRALPFGRKPIYRGLAELTFYQRDLFEHANKLTLVLKRPGYEYRYVWVSRDQG